MINTPSSPAELPARSSRNNGANRADAQERWRQIAEAATQLFRRKGFASTSINDISEAVGLLKGSLYYYIESKEDLLFKILRGLHADGEDIVAAVDFDSSEPLNELETYIKSAAMFAARNSDRLAIFIRDFHYVSEDRRREIISEREMYANTVRRLIIKAKDCGLTDRTLDVSLASTLIAGAVSSTHQWLNVNGPRPVDEAAAEIAAMLTNALRPSGVIKSAVRTRQRRGPKP